MGVLGINLWEFTYHGIYNMVLHGNSMCANINTKNIFPLFELVLVGNHMHLFLHGGHFLILIFLKYTNIHIFSCAGSVVLTVTGITRR